MSKTHIALLMMLKNEEKRIKALKWLKVEDIWGIGRQHAKKLKAIDVNTAYDFTKLDDSWVKKNLAIVGLRYVIYIHRPLCWNRRLPRCPWCFRRAMCLRI